MTTNTEVKIFAVIDVLVSPYAPTMNYLGHQVIFMFLRKPEAA